MEINLNTKEKFEEGIPCVTFDEGIYSFTSNFEWQEYSQIRVFYSKILEGSIQKKSTLCLKVKSNHKGGSYQSDPLDIYLNYTYQVHYIDRASFLKEYLENDLSKEAPLFIIDLGLKSPDKDESDHIFLGESNKIDLLFI